MSEKKLKNTIEPTIKVIKAHSFENNTKKYQIIIKNLLPIPASRPRIAKGRAYYNKRYQEYKTILKKLFESENFDIIKDSKDNYLLVNICFGFKPPDSYSETKKKWLSENFIPCKKGGDRDNLDKAILDAMNKIVYEDDRMIIGGAIDKRYNSMDIIIIEIKERLI